MTSATKNKHAFLSRLFILLSSMRFAIGLLTILAIASVIGTVLKQNEPYPNYAFEFGPFWFEIFEKLGLYDVYQSAWFLIILGFLVLSTSLCVIRNTPNFLREMRSFREKASDTSLKLMPHSQVLEGHWQQSRLEAWLQAQGYRFKIVTKDNGKVLLAAKKGTANKLGYFFAHIAMIVICIGGLLDGNLPTKIRELTGQLQAETREVPQSQVPAISRLDTSNLSFRGNVSIAENKSADVIFLNAGQGYYVQELPFIITLNKFYVDYYSNGMPKLFASDITVTDKATGKVEKTQISVNHPYRKDGIAIYQASFGDGGSPLTLNVWPIESGTTQATAIKATSLNSQALNVGQNRYQLEMGDLRLFNIEEMTPNGEAKPTDLTAKLNDARNVKQEKLLKNLGPSISYKLRDDKGQAKEYQVYMAPIQQDGASYLVAGVRSEVGQPFSYIRLPLDASLKVDQFMRFQAAIHQNKWFKEIAEQAANDAYKAGAISQATQASFAQSIEWILQRYSEGGFVALETFLDAKVPEEKRQAIAQTYIKILQGTAPMIMNKAQAEAGLPPLANTPENYRFLLDSLVASSALAQYGAPVFIALDGFEPIQASGLQLTRSPGKNLVYLGSLLLVLGIILMFYIREIRIWLVLSDNELGFAMTSNRHTRDLDQQFEQALQSLQSIRQG